MEGPDQQLDIRHSVQDRANKAMGEQVPMNGATIFELGGDSLKAAQIAADVGRDVGVEVPVDLVFDAEDLDDLAAQLQQRLDADRP